MSTEQAGANQAWSMLLSTPPFIPSNLVRTVRSARHVLLTSALLASVACGGSIEGGASPTEGNSTSSPPVSAVPTGSSGGTSAPLPPLPKGPISETVATSDVSILMPLPNDVAGTGLLRADTQGPLGELLPRKLLETDLETTSLDFEGRGSGYDALRVVGVRLDPCSARSSGTSCDKGEVRLVLQALTRDQAGRAAYADGGVHLIYDVPPNDLFDMLLEVLTAKKENGNLGSAALGPHPILTAQGLTGPFAERLHTIVLRHVGATRLVKVTVFNHGNMDEDAWTFAAIENVGGSFVKASIGAHRSETSQTVVGSSATGEITNTRANTYPELGVDSVDALVGGAHAAPGSAEALALSTAFEAVVRVDNPTAHTTETTTCANCHLAEGARRIGEGLYAFQSVNVYRSPRTGLPVPAPRDERTSVTNLHAFGYLGRQVSVSQRTANESENVAWRFGRELMPR